MRLVRAALRYVTRRIPATCGEADWPRSCSGSKAKSRKEPLCSKTKPCAGMQSGCMIRSKKGGRLRSPAQFSTSEWWNRSEIMGEEVQVLQRSQDEGLSSTASLTSLSPCSQATYRTFARVTSLGSADNLLCSESLCDPSGASVVDPSTVRQWYVSGLCCGNLPTSANTEARHDPFNKDP